MKRTLRLRREALLDLTPADLASICGGGPTVGDHCGPPFDTTWLPVLTTGRFTEATCTW
jgi:hypothetical protein